MEKSRLETRLTSGQGRERDTLTTVGSVNSDIEVSVTCLQLFCPRLFLQICYKLLMHFIFLSKR